MYPPQTKMLSHSFKFLQPVWCTQQFSPRAGKRWPSRVTPPSQIASCYLCDTSTMPVYISLYKADFADRLLPQWLCFCYIMYLTSRFRFHHQSLDTQPLSLYSDAIPRHRQFLPFCHRNLWHRVFSPTFTPSQRHPACLRSVGRSDASSRKCRGCQRPPKYEWILGNFDYVRRCPYSSSSPQSHWLITAFETKSYYFVRRVIELEEFSNNFGLSFFPVWLTGFMAFLLRSRKLGWGSRSVRLLYCPSSNW